MHRKYRDKRVILRVHWVESTKSRYKQTCVGIVVASGAERTEKIDPEYIGSARYWLDLRRVAAKYAVCRTFGACSSHTCH